MTEKQFYSTTPRTFNNILAGRRRKEEAEFKDAWERARLIAYTSLVPHLGKGNGKTAERLIPFSWDKEKLKAIEDPVQAFKKSKAIWEEIDRKRNEAKKLKE